MFNSLKRNYKLRGYLRFLRKSCRNAVSTRSDYATCEQLAQKLDCIDPDWRTSTEAQALLQQMISQLAATHCPDAMCAGAKVFAQFNEHAVSAVPILRQWLLRRAHPDPMVAVAYALGRLGKAAAPVIPDLISIVANDLKEWRESREAAVQALGSLGPLAIKSVPTLIENGGFSDLSINALYKIEPEWRLLAQNHIPRYEKWITNGCIWYSHQKRGTLDNPPLIEEKFSYYEIERMKLVLGHLRGTAQCLESATAGKQQARFER